MKELLRITSVLCGIMALVTVVFGMMLLTGHGFYVGIAMFSMVRRGTVMGYFGNILGIAVTALGFGTMSFYGIMFRKISEAKKKAFIWGIVMSVLCALSLIVSIIGRTFNFGDIVLLLLPIIYTYALIKNA